MCESGSFITQVDTRLHGGILWICAVGGQQDIYLTAPASVQCLELTMSMVMGINNADPWLHKNSLSPWLASQHCSLCSTLISHYTARNSLALLMLVECWGLCCNEVCIACVNRMTDICILAHCIYGKYLRFFPPLVVLVVGIHRLILYQGPYWPY